MDEEQTEASTEANAARPSPSSPGAAIGPDEGEPRREDRLARVILDQMYQFVALLDDRGNLLDANKPALEGAGYRREAIVGRPFWLLDVWRVSPEVPGRIERAVRDAAAGRFVRFETDIYGAKSGEMLITLDFSLKPVLDDRGRVAYLLAEGRNITEKKLAEAELARKAEELRILNERLREFDRLKTGFFANISHELRTPLALILGPVRRHLDAADLPEERRRDLEVVERNARTLLKHVDDLLDLSRLEAGRMQARYAEVDLARLARFVASHFEVLAGERRVALTIEAPESSVAQADSEKFQRVLLNLLSNAFKFTPEGGAIRLAMRREGDRAVFIVEDTGPGVPVPLRQAVFERFRQADGGSTRRHGGTGLGLAIVKEFVGLHRGTVTIGEAPGGGAAFTVEIPMAAPPGVEVASEEAGFDAVAGRQAAEELSPRPPARGPEAAVAGPEAPLVLVVEDHPEMNAFVAETLSPGHRVVAAHDGREGLEKALALRPDLIVSDVMMPGLGGDELVRELRSRPELDGTPILLLTAKADEALRVRLLSEGAQDYLDKPFSPEELRARAGQLIGERRRAAAALRESYGLLRAVVEGVTDAVYVKDAEGRYLLINTAGADLLGRPVETVLGRDDREFFTPGTARRIMEEDRRVMAEGTARTCEEVGTAAGVTRTYLSTKGPYRDDRGRVIGLIGISRDISHRKRAEDELRRAKEAAEAALRAKDDFLAVLSHELRTPLTPVLASASALEARPDLPPDLREDLGVIRRNAEHEARLIDDLLDLTEILRGQARLHVEAVDVHAVLHAALEDCRAVIEAKRLEVSLGPWAGQRHAWADPRRLRQVFWNLLDNAIKFTPEGGRIALRSSNDTSGRLVIQVADTGLGIEAGALERIFDAFEQAVRTVRAGRGGLGLGLSLCRRLVEMHGGRLTAASEGSGRGATFILELATIADVVAPSSPPSSPAGAGRTGLSILLVEDHEDTLRVVARLLGRLGHSVRAARGVAEALDLAARERFDLLVSDIGLPDGSGLDVMRAVRGRHGLRGIALSGFGREADIRRSREAGFEDHLVKPVDFQALKDMIEAVAS
jgi:PAS domain S-box-containing protein